MGEIKTLGQADISSVAELFQRILRRSRQPVTPSLEACLANLFLDGPDCDPDINSHVHVRDDGVVSGFIGALPLPMLVGDKPVRGALCGTLMVDDHGSDPFAGARLMRAFLAGPQDISLTETANDISTAMWRKLRGTVLPDHSLEWLRIIRPAGFIADKAAGVIGAARLFAPLAKPLDALFRRGSSEPRWTSLPSVATPGNSFPTVDTDDAAAVALFQQFTEPYAARPRWEPERLRRMVAESRRKALYGSMVRRTVTARDGRPVGMFLYYGDPGRIGRVVQILSAPGQAGAVIDSMLAHADERGMVALRGRTMPVLLDAMLGRRFVFLHASSSIVHARDPALLEPFRAGKAFFNGFAGESWSRLIGDSFD
jgi:hypothetical protein